MKALLIPAYYLAWHYTTALGHILTLYRNVVFFSFNFFSIPELLRTIFRPFRTREFVSHKSEDQEHIIVTVVMGVVGFLVRTVTIICGFCSFLLTFVFWLSVFLLWLSLPIVSVLIFTAGLIRFLQ